MPRLLTFDTSILRPFIALSVLIATVTLAALPAEFAAQCWLAGLSCLAFWLILGQQPLGQVLKVAVVVVGVFSSSRYLIWRTTETLPWSDPVGMPIALILLAAEVYAYLIALMSVFIIVETPPRKAPPPVLDTNKFPKVDVLVPTYTEDEALLEVTLLAALSIDYPADKLKVYLLDDGGTAARRRHSDPVIAARARARFMALTALCKRTGVTYFTREENERAKAGNLNAALARTEGELVLILDADHVPTRDILKRTVPWFKRDDKLFLVQTPHFFINPDPIERNLDTFGAMPGENEIFYYAIQNGLHAFNASFFCGSAALLRRKYLLEAGGIFGLTVTEDAETSLELHAKGYNSAYIPRPMVAGLAAESFAGFIVQRMRWAQGMIQILLLKNPLLLKGLSPGQRLGYFNACAFWFFPFSRLAFILCPVFSLLTGIKVIDAGALALLAYGTPHVWGSIAISMALYGRARPPFTSELYEVVQCVHCARAIIEVFRNPCGPSFVTTPKNERADADFVTPLARPIYLLFYLVLIAEIVGILHIGVDPARFNGMVVLLFWNSLHLVLLLCAIGVMFERVQRRDFPRIPIEAKVRIATATGAFPAVPIFDISVTGFAAPIEAPEAKGLALGHEAYALLPLRGGGVRELTMYVSSRRQIEERTIVGFSFAQVSTEERRDIVDFIYGDSARWVAWRDHRAGGATPAPKGRLTALLIGGLRRAFDHYRAFIRGEVAI
ncbi:UDP-forming cellulose synthase catalytic subunit [Pelagibacterium halotolerans]|uniref:UDP-forming cellulose synthase catalytic subunit n=1 Tax=Pelagibacterium halotolerans TaxID=531813 RepID=UPI00384C9501